METKNHSVFDFPSGYAVWLYLGADVGIAAITFAMFLGFPYIKAESLMLSLLLVMSALRSVGTGIQIPAVNATLLGLVPQESLMRYNGINATMQSIVQFAVLSFQNQIYLILNENSTPVSVFRTAHLPPCKSMILLAIVKPRPVPELERDLSMR